MLTLGMKFVLHLSLLIFLFSCSPEKNDASDIEFRTLDISSADSPPSECRRSSTTAGRQYQMDVVAMNGACGPQQQPNQRRPTLAEILRLDQLRGETRLEAATDQLQNANKVMESSKIDEQVVNNTVQLVSNSYIVQLNVPGRQQPLSLVLDTGCGITIAWDDDQLSSPILCDDIECADIIINNGGRNPGKTICDTIPTCSFNVTYDDHGLGEGTISNVPLAGFPNFLLWLGKYPMINSSADGVFGLGKKSFLSSQKRFSYCLPSTSSSTGYFTYGTKNNGRVSLLMTPFVNTSRQNASYDNYYFVDIVAITVGKTRLQIDYKSDIKGTLILTKVQITKLPPVAYNKLRDEFKLQMEKLNYPAAKKFSIFDTCYDTTNGSSITAPTVSFTFGNDVTVDLDVSRILYVVNSTLLCLAFAQASNPGGFAIFGSMQQRTLEMVFDVDNGMLGIGQHGCA